MHLANDLFHAWNESGILAAQNPPATYFRQHVVRIAYRAEGSPALAKVVEEAGPPLGLTR